MRTMLDEVARLAEGPVAEFAAADRNRCSTRAAHHLRARRAGQVGAGRQGRRMVAHGLAEEAGVVARLRAWAINEQHSANPIGGLLGGRCPAMASPRCRRQPAAAIRWAAKGLERRAAATMVLTEPDAGSDVGAGRAKAIAQPDKGTWHIEGVKRSSPAAKARRYRREHLPPGAGPAGGAGPGTKGLSLFYVPKYLFDPDTLEIGPRNGVFATGLEHKMGLKSSLTCELIFGAHGVPAVGYLVGDVHNGIAQMFTVIEYA